MQRAEDYQNERLDHLGIVAGVCQELGLATWLDALAPQPWRRVQNVASSRTLRPVVIPTIPAGSSASLRCLIRHLRRRALR
jgi:hypothetical protein